MSYLIGLVQALMVTVGVITAALFLSVLIEVIWAWLKKKRKKQDK